MQQYSFPVIDPVATGRNILFLRKKRGLTVRDLQVFFNFGEPRAIYKWQTGQTLPSIDNLYALSVLLQTPMDQILVGARERVRDHEPQDESCGSVLFGVFPFGGRPFRLLPLTRRERSL